MQTIKPITSYGIILFYIQNENIVYLASQRRDTIEYADFLRGRYTSQNLQVYFELMTLEERSRLSKYTFDELWDDLWVNHKNSLYRETRAKAYSKFKDIAPVLKTLLGKTTSDQTEPEWGFPKGKKNHTETEISCAFREFTEETKLSIEYINLLNLPPSVEIFKGSDNKMYQTKYYIARVNDKLPINKMTHTGIRTETISEEISNLLWGTRNELSVKLPPWRKILLEETETKIKRFLLKNQMRTLN